MTDADKVAILRTALEGVLPILVGPEPEPDDLREWARRVNDAEMALLRTRPMSGAEVSAALADIITRGTP